MKHKLLKSLLLLSALVVGSGNVWADDNYKLVTNVSQLSDGDVILIASDKNATSTPVSCYAVGAANNANNRKAVSASVSEDIITTSVDNDNETKSGMNTANGELTKPLEITLVASSSNWNLKEVISDANVYLNGGYKNSSNNKNQNHLKVAESAVTATGTDNANGVWSIEINTTSYVASITNQNGYKIQLNGTIFGSYVTAQTDVYIYKKQAAVSVTSLSVKTAPTKVRYEVGETLDMTGFVLDADGADVSAGYTMTMGGASISNGATLSSAGKKTITVTYGGQTVDQAISVGAVTGISVTTPPTKTSYDTGDLFDPTGMEVTASLSTGELSDPDTWTKVVTSYTYSPDGELSSSDDEVTITYATKTTTQAITVTDVAVTGVSLKASTIIEKEKTETLIPTFTPSNATNKAVTWESDDESVATVSAGVVTAVAAGTANITVTTVDGGKTATCVVTVVNEKGSIDAPYSVAEVKAGTATGSSKYVTGYIVGCFNSGNKSGFSTTDFNIASNIAIADSPTETNVDNTIAVQMPSAPSDIRSNFNVQNNPHLAGVAMIKICGNIENYINNSGVKSLSSAVEVAEAVKVTAAGYATWASTSPLDFTGKSIEAYYATTKGNGTGVNFTRIYKVPANTGVLLHYTGGKTEEIPVFDGTGAASTTGNKFVPGTGAAVASVVETTKHNYILNNGGSGLGFYKANGQTVAKNRAYIQIDESNGNVKEFITLQGLDDDADGINEVNGEGLMVNGPVYDLQGRRVQKPDKGLYIVNGKKVLF